MVFDGYERNGRSQVEKMDNHDNCANKSVDDKDVGDIHQDSDQDALVAIL